MGLALSLLHVIFTTCVKIDENILKGFQVAKCLLLSRLFVYPRGSIFNPLLTNGPSHHYHLDESIFNFRGIGSNFAFLFHFSMKIMPANKIVPDGTPRFL